MKKLLNFTSFLAMFAGGVMVVVGAWGICFTYQNVSKENIVTPSDASIPGKHVRGPMSLKSQADVVRKHTLEMSGGLTYAEMPRQVQKKDEWGNPVFNDFGEPVMVENEARNTWVTATAITTALNLGIVTYMLSGLVLFLGLVSMWTGYVFLRLKKKIV
jgi:hypothetical protein